jgi:HSP90 family molecular chaperone
VLVALLFHMFQFQEKGSSPIESSLTMTFLTVILIVFPCAIVGFNSVFVRPRVGNFLGRVSPATSCMPRMTATTVVEPEQFKFESNVARVMDIIINSLYSNKDVFIRELVSNAADACGKKRFLSLTTGSSPEELVVRVSADREKNTLTIEDRGVGMNKDELIQNLGRIAESGTKRFLDNMGQKKDEVSLIGQFGVGFYSGFLVAKKVEVVTKGSSGVQLRWSASGDSLGQYTIEQDTSEPIATTGTRIVLHLKDECDQYLDDVALRALLEKYSEFIPFPIQ